MGTVKVKQKSQYGSTVFYPANDLAELFAKVAGTKTLTASILCYIKEAGFDIEVFTDKVEF